MEVMGLMLGEFVDDYTVRVIDVFAMPQTGTVSDLITPLIQRGGQYPFIISFRGSASKRSIQYSKPRCWTC